MFAFIHSNRAALASRQSVTQPGQESSPWVSYELTIVLTAVGKNINHSSTDYRRGN